jgi:hypothetical protein
MSAMGQLADRPLGHGFGLACFPVRCLHLTVKKAKKQRVKVLARFQLNELHSRLS